MDRARSAPAPTGGLARHISPVRSIRINAAACFFSEEASATLGAGALADAAARRVAGLVPALVTGLSLAFARGVGEYGSVIFIAGNMPIVSEIAPLLIVIKLEEYDYAGAARSAWSCWRSPSAPLLAINPLQAWSRRQAGDAEIDRAAVLPSRRLVAAD